MRQFKLGSALLVTMILAGCGGGSDVPAKPKFASQVSFGDSLSDVGSYNVGMVSGLGGGQFTINAASSVKAVTPTNWTEFTSLSLGLGMPCAAQTGLDNGSGAAPGTPAGTVVPVTNYPGCTGYAQGGSRVTLQPGIGNHLVTTGGFALTVPVATQISNHLATHATPNAPGKFTGNEIVLVMAGANDVFYQAASISAGLPAASGVAAVQTAATELANDVKSQIIGNGAKYVVVANIPDISVTPYGVSLGASVSLIDTLVTAFNAQLQADLPDSANVLNVDAYTASKDEVANAAKYNLTNVSATACNLNYPYNLLASSGVANSGSSLVCNAGNLNTNVSPTDHYLFADMVHPTPYGHLLFATYVLQAMTNKGWY
ncbi:MAG: putative lipase / esterase protein [Candidatus Gallionella acididurans]|uniref:Putative lipase / esterase protein n=1 Tax=Candidatus Gallionella acididurans TaxID=1796491 RepID=A0A139BVP7_9PROT|nr:MAG: putative lipase / esterase protein [Candidatus Gallionella acididurans]